MTYASDEISVKSGTPVELHKWALRGGADAWVLTPTAVDVVYDGRTYQAEPGLERDELDEQLAIFEEELEVRAPRTCALAQLFLASSYKGIIDYTLYRGHGSNFVTYWQGVLKCVVPMDGDKAVFVMESKAAEAARAANYMKYTRHCNADIFDSQCGLNRADYKAVGVITSVSGEIVESTLFTTTSVDGYYSAGYIVVSGFTRHVDVHDKTAGTIKMVGTIPNIAVGMPFEIYPGCNGTKAVCNGWYSNGTQFAGCPWIPDIEPFTRRIL